MSESKHTIYESRAITHAHGCWGWGPRHYECAVGQIGRDEVLLKRALEALESADWYIGQLEWIVYSPYQIADSEL